VRVIRGMDCGRRRARRIGSAAALGGEGRTRGGKTGGMEVEDRGW